MRRRPGDRQARGARMRRLPRPSRRPRSQALTRGFSCEPAFDTAGSSMAPPLGDDHLLSRTSPPEQPSLECRGARPSSAAVSSKLFVCLITCDHLTAPSQRRRPCADGVGAFWPSLTMCRAPFGFSRLILTGWHRRCVLQMRAPRKRNENWSGRRAAPSGKTSVTTC